jgi:L-2-hydroxyglutarate oxidase
MHQTGHNSGVIHSGVYYTPGSLKARLCRLGAEATKAFCQEHAIGFESCGKLIVATNAVEHERLAAIEARAAQSGIEVKRLDKVQFREKEPEIEGTSALHVPSTGIVDYRQVCETLGRVIRELGGAIVLGEKVEADLSIACPGLQSAPWRGLRGRKSLTGSSHSG